MRNEIISSKEILLLQKTVLVWFSRLCPLSTFNGKNVAFGLSQNDIKEVGSMKS